MWLLIRALGPRPCALISFYTRALYSIQPQRVWFNYNTIYIYIYIYLYKYLSLLLTLPVLFISISLIMYCQLRQTLNSFHIRVLHTYCRLDVYYIVYTMGQTGLRNVLWKSLRLLDNGVWSWGHQGTEILRKSQISYVGKQDTFKKMGHLMASLDSSGKSMATTLSIVEQDTLCYRYIILLFT